MQGIDGTQNSTTRTTFPKVSYTLPEYFSHPQFYRESDEEEDTLIQDVDDAESSDRDWLPNFDDTLETDDEDVDLHCLHESGQYMPDLADWCMRPESFTPVYLDTTQLAFHYHPSSRNSNSVDFA